MPFEFNFRYYSHIFQKKDVNLYSWSKVADKPTQKLRNLMVVYRVSLLHIQKPPKQVHN